MRSRSFAILCSVGLLLACHSSSQDQAPPGHAPPEPMSDAGADARGDAAESRPPAGRPADLDGSTNGSRIHVRRFHAPDGTTRVRDFFDTMLSTPCVMMRTADGKTRCVSKARGLGSYGVFSDAQCTHQVSFARCSDYDMEYTTSCAAPTLSKAASSAPTVYSNRGGACTALPATSGATYATGTTPVDPSFFVAFSPAVVPLDPTSEAVIWVGDDGTRVWSDQAPSWLRDTMSGTDANLGTTPDGALRALPRGMPDIGVYFVDGACKELAVMSIACPFEPAPLFARRGDAEATACGGGGGLHIFSVGPTWSGQAFFTVNAMCVPVPDLSSVTASYAPIGAEVDLTNRSRATTTTLGADARLTAVAYTLGGHLLPPRESWIDTQMNIPCSPGKAADGVFRCVPGGEIGALEEYADAECTQRLVMLNTPSSCNSPPRFFLVEDAGCDPALHVFPFGMPITPALVYTKDARGKCTGSAPQRTAQFRPTLAEVSPATMAPLTSD